MLLKQSLQNVSQSRQTNETRLQTQGRILVQMLRLMFMYMGKYFVILRNADETGWVLFGEIFFSVFLWLLYWITSYHVIPFLVSICTFVAFTWYRASADNSWDNLQNKVQERVAWFFRNPRLRSNDPESKLTVHLIQPNIWDILKSKQVLKTSNVLLLFLRCFFL